VFLDFANSAVCHRFKSLAFFDYFAICNNWLSAAASQEISQHGQQ
tara:strand:+ start:752 stop:886 length:135 start_codon:yes stop_codon:yes gene_type:complete